ncbi:hypothetical protein [Actinoplanes sp. NPDC026670]|uniref:hypothetical protein n=1 Tax=Actinoplanes sp. NPDC026670 TaxID=3154700 RepID=UPI0033D60AE0
MSSGIVDSARQVLDRFAGAERPSASHAERIAWAGALADSGDPGAAAEQLIAVLRGGGQVPDTFPAVLLRLTGEHARAVTAAAIDSGRVSTPSSDMSARVPLSAAFARLCAGSDDAEEALLRAVLVAREYEDRRGTFFRRNRAYRIAVVLSLFAEAHRGEPERLDLWAGILGDADRQRLAGAAALLGPLGLAEIDRRCGEMDGELARYEAVPLAGALTAAGRLREALELAARLDPNDRQQAVVAVTEALTTEDSAHACAAATQALTAKGSAHACAAATQALTAKGSAHACAAATQALTTEDDAHAGATVTQTATTEDGARAGVAVAKAGVTESEARAVIAAFRASPKAGRDRDQQMIHRHRLARVLLMFGRFDDAVAELVKMKDCRYSGFGPAELVSELVRWLGARPEEVTGQRLRTLLDVLASPNVIPQELAAQVVGVLHRVFVLADPELRAEIVDVRAAALRARSRSDLRALVDAGLAAGLLATGQAKEATAILCAVSAAQRGRLSDMAAPLIAAAVESEMPARDPELFEEFFGAVATLSDSWPPPSPDLAIRLGPTGRATAARLVGRFPAKNVARWAGWLAEAAAETGDFETLHTLLESAADEPSALAIGRHLAAALARHGTQADAHAVAEACGL